MNGRLESKIKIEKRTLESIKDSGYNLTSFFNSLAAKYEASSKETYITYIINFLKAMNKPVSEITSDEINNYFIDLTYKTNKKGEITETSGTYRATVHSAIHKYFTYLYDTKQIPENPMDLVARPSLKKNNQINRESLTSKEIQKTINYLKKEDDKWKYRDLLMFMIFLYTGIRCEALIEINEDSFDFHNMTLTVIDKRDKKRVFDIDEDIEYLYDKVIEQKKQYKLNTPAVFISGYTGRISSSSVRRVVSKYTSITKKHITPHGLRRSYARNLYKETGDIYMVQNALGHEKVETTAKCYVEGDPKEAASKGMSAMKKHVTFI